MSSWKLTDSLRREIYKLARVPQTGVSLRQMVQFGPQPSPGSVFHASNFIVEELPIRLSHRVKDLEELPSGLNNDPSIQRVRDWYAQSFEELTSLPKPSISDEMRAVLYPSSPEKPATPGAHSAARPTKFEDDGIVIEQLHARPRDETDHAPRRQPTRRAYYVPTPSDVAYTSDVLDYNKLVNQTLVKIKRRHDATVTTIARGVQHWKHKNNFAYLDGSINQFLDRFYMSRIGIRMLIGQTIALYEQSTMNITNDNYVGIICLDTNVMEIAQDAIDAARFACEEHYNIMEAPKVQLWAPEDLNFMYVPGHLVHMLFETLKNSLRATVEHHSSLHPDKNMEDIEFPPVKVIVSEGNEDITIKVSDEGGGIPRSVVPLIWTYFYTSAKQIVEPENGYKPPFMGLGVGLPHSRLYARYFSGDLKLISMEGYGTDVYFHLNRLSSSSEPLQ
ncbi:hypothetical protein KL930_004248 [Ogataea haglerorum]|uniref:Protein-serine/threonine kinase n=1 Tax=Ogataea haglerorum TaxID=1937702 RepID=A0AAN6D2P3_9ASCO|nr:hypothetical protein KL915_004357 [Ogataea haglerorum]KAG7693914.1 hypothetical protein KL951_004393 [Ogataea haglerorum]KAG7704227.1 hypothetical protein KL914_004214 [Ogataea haglerorum]KAG7715966.1 hypothetical protein KL913_003779 [Ogataea haglerorum]KAG7716468.1 hypothetical protein KL949_003759 [Ogataea haglerorum]